MGSVKILRVKQCVADNTNNKEARAIYTYCYGYVFNLAICDLMKRSKVIRDSLDDVLKMSKLVKHSLRHDNIV